VPSTTIALHVEAAADYDAAFDWYLQRSPEAARGLDAEFERGLKEIASAPQRWAPGRHETRRFLLRQNPFLIIYREQRPETILVLAVAHTSRRPDYWKDRS